MVVLITGAILAILVLALALWGRQLSGENLHRYDRDYPQPVAGEPPSAAAAAVDQRVRAFGLAGEWSKARKRSLETLRAEMDQLGTQSPILSQCIAVDDGIVRGEWLIPSPCDTQRRLLYVHGGGFSRGSLASHRMITDGLAQKTGMAVFSLDYRLLPEATLEDAYEDVMTAMLWLSGQGPEGSQEAVTLVLAGDSAGGNLTLGCLQRARDGGFRCPDAAVALSPAADLTMSAPSILGNADTDLMLGPPLKPYLRLHRYLRSVVSRLTLKTSPADPKFSPLHGDLASLPPTLIQVSVTEMLLDDAIRYHHKAEEAGSSVTLETFANMVHVWPLFYPELPEAVVALERIATFLVGQGCALPPADSGDGAA